MIYIRNNSYINCVSTSHHHSFQLLKLENILRWSFFTFIYNRSSYMNYFVYISQHLIWLNKCSSKTLNGNSKRDLSPSIYRIYWEYSPVVGVGCPGAKIDPNLQSQINLNKGRREPKLLIRKLSGENQPKEFTWKRTSRLTWSSRLLPHFGELHGSYGEYD